MGSSLNQPKGAVADMRELEYISILHQTDEKELRMDGTIQGECLMLICMCF